MTLKICPICGCALTTPPPAYFVPGRAETAGIYHCKDCGYTGPPLVTTQRQRCAGEG